MKSISRKDIIDLFGKFEGEMYENDGKICLESLCPFKENVNKGDKMPEYRIVKVKTIASSGFKDGKYSYFAINEIGYSYLGILTPAESMTEDELEKIESCLIHFGFAKKKEVQMSLFPLF